MRAWKVTEVKAFMARLFLEETFDAFLLCELEIQAANLFRIQGRLNRKWLDTDELQEIGEREFSRWGDLRGISFEMIRGRKSPERMKIVLSLPRENVERVLGRSGCGLAPDQVEGLYLNIRYENGELWLVTGTSLRVFTMEKGLEQEWDKEMLALLKSEGIACE